MNFKAPLVVAACSLVLGSCAWWDRLTQPHGGGNAAKAVVCKEKECRVAVTVSACKITVDPEVLGIAKGVHDVDIVWEITKSPGVIFPRVNGIFFKEKDRAAAAKQFRDPRLLLEGKQFRWKDANIAAGEFQYGVTVVDNGKACTLDPIVINDM
jgi:hypothetical protein